MQALGLIAIGLLFAAAAGSLQAQVAPEFRTAPRSLITQKLDRNRMAPTLGALNPIVSKYPDLGEVDRQLPIKHIQLLLRRPAERQAAFDAQVEALHTRGNPSFHKWLTPPIVGREFGPSDADLATIKGYLQSEGFTINYTGTSGLYVDFSGTAAQVEHTFKTSIHSFQVPDVDGVRYAAVQEAALPEALTPAVVGFVALSNVMSGHKNLEKVVPAATTASLPVGVRKDGVTPQDTVSTTNYAVSPQDFYTIYNENPVLTAGYKGTGVTIALLEQSAINTDDVTTFRSTYGVSPTVPVSLKVYAGYGSNTCTTPGLLASDEDEAILDTEWASSIAPSADIIFMECAGESVPLGVFYSAEAVIDNNLADTMSLSYGTYETYSSGTEDALANLLWEQAASQGETVVVSAGDSGAATEDGNFGYKYARSGITVNGFSSTPWNVSAGGTDFMDTFNGEINASSTYQIGNYWNKTIGTISSAKSYIPEMPWDNSCGSTIYSYYYYGSVTEPAAYFCSQRAIANNITAGGGGPSIVNARPSWQLGTVYGLPPTSTYNGRLQPDISLFAANGLWKHDLTYYQSDASGIGYAGGTSFVAPQLAGVFALLKQYTGERQGQPDYILYNMAAAEYGTAATPLTNNCNGSGATSAVPTSSSPSTSCIFYDVEAGTNAVPCATADTDCYSTTGGTYGVLSTNGTSSSTPAFTTTVGWDMATGIGSINIYNLFANWMNATNQYTPTVTLTDTTATVAYGNTDSLIATISGSGSYPTGSVQFTYTGPTSGTLGTSAVAGSAGCSNSSTCVETATESIYPTATPSVTPYVFTANYNATNENYVSATSSTVSITVTKQVPTLAVQNVMVVTGTATATLTATITYASSTGSVAPTGATPFTVTGGSGGTVNGSCTTTSSTVVTCTATYPTSTLIAGNYTISATYTGDTNYTAITTPATGTLSVGAALSPTITFSVASPQYTMYPTVALTYTSNSLGTVSYAITGTTGTALGTISGSNLTLTPGGSGTITVLLSQAAAGSYTSGSSSSTFTVNAGSVWIADNDTSDVSTLDLSTGVAVTPSPGLAGAGVGTPAFPLGVAFDASGDAWIASSAGISEFKPSTLGPVAVSSTPFTGGGVTTPLAVAVDGLGVIWVANNNGTVSALTNAGVAISPATGYTASGVTSRFTNFGGIAIDLSGSVWVTNSGDNSVTQILGVAAPAAPLSTSLANGKTGTRP